MNGLFILAEAGGGGGDTITVAGLCLLLTALAAFAGRVAGIHKGRKDVTLTNIPLRVELEKDFVRREEWTIWRGEVRADLVKLEGMMERVFDRVDDKHTELLNTIERAAKIGVDGRVHLWNELRDQGRKLAKVEANTDVAVAMKSLAEEMKQQRTHPQKR